VIKVSGLIEQLDIGEAEKKEDRADSVKETDGNSERKQSEGDEMGMHPKIRPGPNPAKAGIGEMKDWIDIQLAHPAFSQKTNHRGKHEQAEKNSEGGEGGDVDSLSRKSKGSSRRTRRNVSLHHSK
jgi:hypothetical protein